MLMLVKRRLLWVWSGGGKGSGPPSPGSVNAHLSARLTQRNWWWAPGFLPHWRSDPPSTRYSEWGWWGGIIPFGEKIGKKAPQDKIPIMKSLYSLFLDRLLYAVCALKLLTAQSARGVYTVCVPSSHSMAKNFFIPYTNLHNKHDCLERLSPLVVGYI